MSSTAQVAITIDPDPKDTRALQCWVDADAGGTKLRLLLDVGSHLSSVPSWREFATADLHSMRTGRGTSGESATKRVIRIPHLRVGDLIAEDVLVELQPDGWPHPPLLGTHVFEPYACAFRFSQGRIDVGIEGSPHWTIWGVGSTPVVELRWDDTSATAIWDTGAGMTLVDQTWAQTHPDVVTILNVQDHGTGTDSTGSAVPGRHGRLAGYSVLGVRFPGNQPCGVIDLSPFNAHMSKPITMFLGLPQIRQVDWLLDFPRRKIAILEPC
jgi:hypothetical protein